MRDRQRNPEKGYGLASDILEYLRELTGGRPLANTAELGQMYDTAPQTIRRNHSEKGEFHGLRPIKIGNRLFWPLTEIARVMSGNLAEQAGATLQKESRSDIVEVPGGNVVEHVRTRFEKTPRLPARRQSSENGGRDD
jgi:hypothetical protein